MLDVVVVNYNAGDVLSVSMSAVLADSSNISGIYVIDNKSTDGSLDAISELSRDNSILSCIRNTRNMGFAAACNLGLKYSTSPYVLFLNPDCVVTPMAIERLLVTLESNPEAALAGPLVLNSDGTEQAGGRRVIPTPWRSLVRAFGLSRLGVRYPRLFWDFNQHRDPLPDFPIEVEAISGACMLARRDAIDQVGPMDEGYFMHCEDLDWCMRFRQSGWKILFVPDARVVHDKGMCSRSRPVFVEWHKHRGMIRFYRKFFRHQYPGALMGLVVLGVWLRFGMIAGRLGLKRLGKGLGYG